MTLEYFFIILLPVAERAELSLILATNVFVFEQRQLELRTRHGQQPLAIAVLDAGGHLVAFQVCIVFAQCLCLRKYCLISFDDRPF